MRSDVTPLLGERLNEEIQDFSVIYTMCLRRWCHISFFYVFNFRSVIPFAPTTGLVFVLRSGTTDKSLGLRRTTRALSW